MGSPLPACWQPGRRTGDFGASAPANWWEQQFSLGHLDIAVPLHGRDSAPMRMRTDEILVDTANHGLMELLPRRDGTRLDGESLSDPRRLHLGYRDAFSQPSVNWSDDPPKPGQLHYRCYGAFRWIYQDVARFQDFLAASGQTWAARLSIPQADAE